MTQPNVVVLDPDQRAARQLQFGFRREGVTATTPAIPADQSTLELGADIGLVVIGGTDLALVRMAREILDDKKLDVSILYAGTATRATAEAAGADETLDHPAYIRDVVTIGRLLSGVAPEARGHIVGSLGELTNVLSLVRALSVLGRSATLTLMRGLRRGEVRFFHGEVTSAQVGLIHGQAALHQLLLWTDARFDFHYEDVVRRQQIPMSHDELFADAERFLEGIKDSSGALSPAMVLEQDVQHVHNLGKQIPTEVHGVLRMFDGHRVLADVLEDSPYRVFETLRVAQRAVEAGLLRVVKSARPKATWRAVLAIEEWLVSTEHRAPDEDTEQDTSGPTAADSGAISAADSGSIAAKLPGKKRHKRNRRQRRANTPLPIAVSPKPTTKPPPFGSPSGLAKTGIDWGALVPRTIGSDIGSLSMVVPVAQASGEIRLPTRALEREKLESLMDTGKRDRIFPSELGNEPSVVFDDRSGPVVDAVPDVAIPRTASAQFRDDVQDKLRDVVAQQKLDVRSRLELESRSAGDSGVDRMNARANLQAEIDARSAAIAGEPDATAPIPKAELDEIIREEPVTPVEPRAKRAEREPEPATTPFEKPDVDDAAMTTPMNAARDSTPTVQTVPFERIDAPVVDEARAKRATDAANLKAAFAGKTPDQRAADDRAAELAVAEEQAKHEAATAAAAAKMRADEIAARNAAARAEAEEKVLALARSKMAGTTKPELGSASDLVRDLVDDIDTEDQEPMRARRSKATSVPPHVNDEPSHPLAALPVKRERKPARITMPPLSKDLATGGADVAKVASDASAVAAIAAAAGAAATAKVSATPNPDVEGSAIVARTLTPSTQTGTTNLAAAAGAAAANKPVEKPVAVDVDHTSSVIIDMGDDASASDTLKEASAASTLVNAAPPPPAVDAAAPVVARTKSNTGRTRTGNTGKVSKTSDTVPTGKVEKADAAPAPRAKTDTGKVAKPAADAKSEPTTSRTKTKPSTPPANEQRAKSQSTPPADRKSAQKITGQTKKQSSPNIANSAANKAVDDLRKDAVAFSDDEEAFFRGGEAEHHHPTPNRPVSVETFDDLDEGYQPVGFWDRLLGRKPEKPEKPKKR